MSSTRVSIAWSRRRRRRRMEFSDIGSFVIQEDGRTYIPPPTGDQGSVARWPANTPKKNKLQTPLKGTQNSNKIRPVCPQKHGTSFRVAGTGTLGTEKANRTQTNEKQKSFPEPILPFPCLGVLKISHFLFPHSLPHCASLSLFPSLITVLHVEEQVEEEEG